MQKLLLLDEQFDINIKYDIVHKLNKDTGYLAKLLVKGVSMQNILLITYV